MDAGGRRNFLVVTLAMTICHVSLRASGLKVRPFANLVRDFIGQHGCSVVRAISQFNAAVGSIQITPNPFGRIRADGRASRLA